MRLDSHPTKNYLLIHGLYFQARGRFIPNNNNILFYSNNNLSISQGLMKNSRSNFISMSTLFLGINS